MQGGLRSQRGLRRLAAGWAFRTERGLWFHWPIHNGRCGKRWSAAAKCSSSCTDLIDREASVGVRPPVAVAFLISRVTGRSIRRL